MPERIFEYRGQWLGQEKGRSGYYRYWYFAGSRKTRRKKLRSTVLDEAKEEFIEEVRKCGAPAKSPTQVQVSEVLAHYVDHKYAAARRAAELVVTGMHQIETITDTPRISDLTLTNQQLIWQFMKDEDLSAKTISTYMISLRAAINFSAKPQIIDAPADAKGDVKRVEVQLLTSPVVIECNEATIAAHLNISESVSNNWIPSFKEFAQWINEIEEDAHFRYVVIALNTWARNEAVFDLRVTEQVDFEFGTLNLNPPGRKQVANKHRPIIRLTPNLRAWLKYWGVDKPISRGRKNVESTLNGIGKEIDLPDMTCYRIRHFMPSMVRRMPAKPSAEQRSIWMGHKIRHGSRTTDRYEHFDPDYLEDAMNATQQIIERIEAELVKLGKQFGNARSLIAPETNNEEVDISKHNIHALFGDDNPRGAAKLDWEKVDMIRHLMSKGKNNIELAKQFNVSEAAIRNIRHERSWKKEAKS